jgi:hypothetical protein
MVESLEIYKCVVVGYEIPRNEVVTTLPSQISWVTI